MSRLLPPRPTMDHLRKQAKAILRAHQERDAAVLPTLRRLAQFSRVGDAEIFAAKVALHEAQYALALDYGFVSWKKLKERVEASAPPLHANPPARWFHGSDRQFDHLRAGSTVTPIIELARAFAHRPRNVSIQNDEIGNQNLRRVEIVHDGQKDGYLYEIEVPDPSTDLRPHPESTLAPGEEMLTTRELSVTLLESLPLADSLRQEYEEPLKPAPMAGPKSRSDGLAP
ncbi:MAG: hypothetical protein IT443_09255 [Phycisphaeraceae bacterium]|nr:hypothetical protein [Phycisphaeraceae bacterium]